MLPVTGTSSGGPSAHTAKAAVEPVESHHSADFAAPESHSKHSLEELKQSWSWHHGATLPNCRSRNKGNSKQSDDNFTKKSFKQETRSQLNQLHVEGESS